MLLTDGNPNATEDLRIYESAILGVANTEMLDLGVKLGLATEEIAEDVLDFLLDHTGADPRTAGRRDIGVADVVVTRQVKRWHALHTLEIVYRDAFNNQLNDRYGVKFREYRELSRSARAQSFHFGVGLALVPIPQATPPAFSAVAGSIPATVYYARVSWTGSDGQEGLPSEMTTYDAPAGSLPVVAAIDPPESVAGFNVYLGLTPDDLALQNAIPVPAGQNFILASGGLVPGRRPGDGQGADLYISGCWMLRRG